MAQLRAPSGRRGQDAYRPGRMLCDYDDDRRQNRRTESPGWDPLDFYEFATGLNWDASEGLRARLPKMEQDILTMTFVVRKNQYEMASVLGVTQGSVSHRLHRAFERLRHFADAKDRMHPQPDPAAKPKNYRLQVAIAAAMARGIVHQTEIGREIGRSQEFVSQLVSKMLCRPGKSDRRYWIEAETPVRKRPFRAVFTKEQAFNPYRWRRKNGTEHAVCTGERGIRGKDSAGEARGEQGGGTGVGARVRKGQVPDAVAPARREGAGGGREARNNAGAEIRTGAERPRRRISRAAENGKMTE